VQLLQQLVAPQFLQLQTLLAAYATASTFFRSQLTVKSVHTQPEKSPARFSVAKVARQNKQS
jgi:hypothetical protein